MHSSLGQTSRGRLGVTAGLNALPLTDPWFEDPTDKTILLQALNDLVDGISTGTSHTLGEPTQEKESTNIPLQTSSFPFLPFRELSEMRI